MLAIILLALLAGVPVLIVVLKGIRTVDQATVAVVTRFGKYSRLLEPGLNIINPFSSKVSRIVPIQNQTSTLTFAAITQDQAAVHFTSTIIYTVKDHSQDTVMRVAYAFIDEDSFQRAMTSAVEASVREFVAWKKQAEVLGLRQDIVDHAKSALDDQLASWGYLLVDLTVNDIYFDPEVMASMSRVVSAKNAQTAAEFEGQALLITRTKQAEAEGRAVVIAAENEAEAARLRGEGIAKFRKAVSEGFAQSADGLQAAGLDSNNLLSFSLWTETIRDVAVLGKGNTIFLDAGTDSMRNTMRRLEGLIAARPGGEGPETTGSAGPGTAGGPGSGGYADGGEEGGDMPAAGPATAGGAGRPQRPGLQGALDLVGQYAEQDMSAKEAVSLLRQAAQPASRP